MEPVTVTRDVDLDLTPDALWRLVSDPTELTGWLGDRVDVDVRPGGTGTIDADGSVRDVRVEHVETGRLVFTWSDRAEAGSESEVVLEVVGRPDGGSQLRISETLLTLPRAPQARARTVAAVRSAWEVRVLSLWACSVAAALV